MKTLIELYDPRPFENVIGTETFRPEKTIFLCPPSIVKNTHEQQRLQRYLEHRGVKTKLEFRTVSLQNTHELIPALQNILRDDPDFALDISGGSDAALFASGAVCAKAQTPVPVFTYSRRKNTFFNIQNAPFADNLPCTLKLSVEDSFLLAGASAMNGRVDNRILKDYEVLIPDMFRLYLRYRRDWVRIVTYMQRISQPEHGQAPTLRVSGAYTVKGDRGRRISAHEKALQDMQRIGLIHGLSIQDQDSVSFTFRDTQIRAWLRDVGSILEVYTYYCCKSTALFQDVRTSVVVDWDGASQSHKVTNEIDVLAVRGIMPLFISCKTCAVKTEALNELALLTERFGSEMARAVIVTAERANAAVRERAQKLGIFVIDIDVLRQNRLQDSLETIAGEG